MAFTYKVEFVKSIGKIIKPPSQNVGKSPGIKTSLSEYDVSADKLPEVIENLKSHGLTALSETGDITLEVSQKILETAS